MDFSFESEKNKLSKENLKEKFAHKIDEVKAAKVKHNISQFMSKYAKVIVSGTIVVALIAVCTVSVIDRNVKNNQPTGVMVSISDVSSGTKSFAGKTFGATILSYDDMLRLGYEAEQLSQLEKSEEQVEAILASINTDKKDSATLNELTAEVDTTEQQEIIQQTTAQTSAQLAGNNNESTVVVDEATGQVTVVAGPSVAPTYASESDDYEYVGEFLLTGYCPCPICCGAWSNMEQPITASGAIAAAGRTVAADTSVFPFGTQLQINGCVYTVEDRGSAIRGNHIDVFFSTHQEALNFGKQYASVYRKVN